MQFLKFYAASVCIVFQCKHKIIYLLGSSGLIGNFFIIYRKWQTLSLDGYVHVRWKANVLYEVRWKIQLLVYFLEALCNWLAPVFLEWLWILYLELNQVIMRKPNVKHLSKNLMVLVQGNVRQCIGSEPCF